ncbi:DEAD/DEAH box helicase, partial [Stappia sp.]|uniref:DEAD/DEAH box helicase n=1 Tax=Stappia sp. TaxID=1870903 RepID=UPI003A9A22BE
MTTFNDLGLAEPILKAIAAEGYTSPTPIQAQGIPAILSGSDVMGLAQTGTGKTASFVLPLLHRIATQNLRPDPKTCTSLILAPTRELASQIADSIRAYGQKVRHSATVVTGGVRPMPQIRALSRGVDIVVATPGRLIDHMQTGAVRLDRTTTIVLDEADHMLDLGFLPAIRQILASLPRDRQTILLSATMPKPIRALATAISCGVFRKAVASGRGGLGVGGGSGVGWGARGRGARGGRAPGGSAPAGRGRPLLDPRAHRLQRLAGGRRRPDAERRGHR